MAAFITLSFTFLCFSGDCYILVVTVQIVSPVSGSVFIEMLCVLKNLFISRYSSEYGLWWGNGLLVINGILGGVAYPDPIDSSSLLNIYLLYYYSIIPVRINIILVVLWSPGNDSIYIGKNAIWFWCEIGFEYGFTGILSNRYFGNDEKMWDYAWETLGFGMVCDVVSVVGNLDYWTASIGDLDLLGLGEMGVWFLVIYGVFFERARWEVVGIYLDFTIRCSIRWERDGLEVGSDREWWERRW